MHLTLLAVDLFTSGGGFTEIQRMSRELTGIVTQALTDSSDSLIENRLQALLRQG
jgi:hypothetical protein